MFLLSGHTPVVLSAELMRLPISHLQSKMAKATSTYVSELVDHMKGLTVTDEETLLDLAVEHVADAAATELGLKQGNNNNLMESTCLAGAKQE